MWMLRSGLAVVDAEGVMSRGARVFDVVADGVERRCCLLIVAERWMMRSARVAVGVGVGCGVSFAVVVAESWIANVAGDAESRRGLNDTAVAAVSWTMRTSRVAGDAEGGRGLSDAVVAVGWLMG